MTSPYEFRPISSADLPLVRAWLEVPHIAAWWGDPDEQFALVRDDLTEPAMEQFVVSAEGKPLGYLQCYRLTAWNAGFDAQPEGCRGIDLFVGDPDAVGRGHGPALVRAFLEILREQGTPRVLSDPDPANAAAIRAYEKAGFRRERAVDTPDGPALLMVRDL